jgi:hypothetical protein
VSAILSTGNPAPLPTGIEHLDGYTRAHLHGAPSLGQFLSLVEMMAVDSQA